MQAPKNTNWLPREAGNAPSTSKAQYCLSAQDKLLIMESLDHIHVLRQYQQMGFCSVCKKISIKKCPGCGIFYCCDECQTYDWPKHQAICPEQRDNMSERNSLASTRRRRGSSFVKQFNGEALMMTDRTSPFTSLANQLNKKTGGFYSGSKSLSNVRLANRQTQNQSQGQNQNQYQYQNQNQNHNQNQNQNQNQNKDRQSKVSEIVNMNTKETKKNATHDRNHDRKKSFSPKKMSTNKKTEERKEAPVDKNDYNAPAELNSISKSAESVSNDTKDKPKQKTVRKNFTKTEPVEVIGTYREGPNRYWVMKLKNLQKCEEIQNTLNKYCANYDPITPSVGLICGCTFSDEWYRAEILALTPETIVHFIDYGNSSVYDCDVFKKLPNHMISAPGLAYLIQFEEGTPEDYLVKDLDSLKLVVMESSKAPDGTPIVSVIGGLFGASSKDVVRKSSEKKKIEKAKLNKERSVMDCLTANSSGMMFFMAGEGTTRFASIIPDNHKDANDCVEKVLSIDNPNSTPIDVKEGEYVLVADKEGNDQRGKVISKLESTYFVYLIDCGDVISTEHVYSLPENLRNLIELGVKVTVVEVVSQELMNCLETCFFAITGEANCGKWPCTLKASEQNVIAKVLLEKPSEVVQWQPKYVDLKSGSTVEISSLCPPNFFYLRSVDVETEQKFLDMNMEMIQFAPKAKHLPVPPSLGELCCAKFLEDGCFYRAVISSVENDKIWVLFVDFGNEQETLLKDIKPIPDSLKDIPFFAVKVKLKNVSSKSWNNMVKEYVEKLTSENIELTLFYSKSISDGVILKEKVSGVVLNDFIEKAQMESHSSASTEPKFSEIKEIFLDDDLKYTSIPNNSVCDLAVLYTDEAEFYSNHTFWATISGTDNFNFVNGDLCEMIANYCAQNSSPYSPSFRELCVAEFEGSWYRAICIGSEGEFFKVFFVDFGNLCELQAKYIRKMNRDFIQSPALAMNCTIYDREKLQANLTLAKKIYKKLSERVNTVLSKVTVVKFEEDTFFLKIPDIEALMSD